MILVDAGAHRAAGRRHPCPCGPEVRRRIIHFNEVDFVARTGDERRTDAAADHINFVTDAGRHMVVARQEQRSSRAPRVCCRVVFLNRREHVVRTRRMDAVLDNTRQRVGAAGDVDLAARDGGRGGAAPRRHRRQLLPFVGRGVVFQFGPRHLADPQMIVEQDNRTALLLRVMVDGLGPPANQRLLVAPARERQDPARARETPVADVFKNQRFRLPAGRQPGQGVESAVRGCAQKLLRRLREWCCLKPWASCRRPSLPLRPGARAVNKDSGARNRKNQRKP